MNLVESAQRNLAETYFALGKSVPGSRIVETAGFRACLSRQDHPIGNFALGLRLDVNVVRSLVGLARRHHRFQVFHTLLDKPTGVVPEMLKRGGFEETSRLHVMSAAGAPYKGDLVSEWAHDEAGREEIAKFMAKQFFSTASTDFRRVISQATTAADSLPLVGFRQRGKLVAAAMIQDTDVIGLYNLCVDHGMRGRGWGEAVVRRVLGWAHESGRTVTLQCEPNLVPWYERLGFSNLGRVIVYRLAISSNVAIM